MSEVVRQVVEEIEVAHPGRITVSSTGDCSGEWDPERIKQVLSNLFGNALAYSPADSAVSVAVRGDADVVVSTRNLNSDGPIPDRVARMIFDPFKRGVVTPAHNRGVGLGLYIADQIVKGHGGTIELSSDDACTVFTVRLPRR